MRTQVRTARAARGEAERAAGAEAFAAAVLDLLASDVTDVTCYMSLPPEPQTGALIAGLLAGGVQPWLPRIRSRDLEWVRIDSSTTYTPGPLGISEPVGAAVGTAAGAQVVIMPATAVDITGRRLGQGGGFYDRALASLPTHANGGPLLVALVFDDEVFPEVPVEQHDRRLDVIVTPTRTLVATRA